MFYLGLLVLQCTHTEGPRSPQPVGLFTLNHRVFCPFVGDRRPSSRTVAPRLGPSSLVPDRRPSSRTVAPRLGPSPLVSDRRPSSRTLVPRPGPSSRTLVPRPGPSSLVPDPRPSSRTLVPRPGPSSLVPDPRPSSRTLVPRPGPSSLVPDPRPSSRTLVPRPGPSSLVPDPRPSSRTLVPRPGPSSLVPDPRPSSRTLVPRPGPSSLVPDPRPSSRTLVPRPSTLVPRPSTHFGIFTLKGPLDVLDSYPTLRLSSLRLSIHHTYIMVAVGVFSRTMFAQTLKNKTEEAFTEAFKTMTPKSSPHVPSDRQGKSVLEQYFPEIPETHRDNCLHIKCALAKRMNSTFQGNMWLCCTHKITFTYVDVLQDLIHFYHHTFHTLGGGPVDIVISIMAN